MARTTMIILILMLWASLSVALPVRYLLTSRSPSIASPYSRWDEARSLHDFEIEDLVQRGPGKIVQSVVSKVKSLGATLSPWSEKNKQRQRQKATLKGLAHEHGKHMAWKKQANAKETRQGAQFQSARVAQKKEKVQAVEAVRASTRRKTWSPGTIPGGLPVKLGIVRR